MSRKLAILFMCIATPVVTAGACGGSTGDTGDASASCSAPNTQCGSTCSNLQTDPTNCGTCGHACSQGQVCSLGACAASCATGTMMCGQSCVNTQSDPMNCGGCGMPCAAGQTCNGGTCGTQCGTGLTMCGSDAGVTACIDTTRDNSNCGGCGQACGVNTTCQASKCVPNLTNVGPVQVNSGATSMMACTTGSGALGRKSAIDDANNLYVAMLCDTGGGMTTLYVASSQNGGFTYGTPVSTGLTGGEGAILIGTGGTPVLYAATTTANGPLLFSMSADLGATWSSAQTLVTPTNGGNRPANEGLSMAFYQNTVYIGTAATTGGTTLDVARNGIGIGDAGLADVDDAGFGVTMADLVAVNLSDIAVDPSNGNVWGFAEANGVYHVAASTNGGQSFGTATNPTNTGALFTDWTLGGSAIFAVGSTTDLYVIPTAAPTTVNLVPGLGAAGGIFGGTDRSIGIDANNALYVATATGNATIQVARVLYTVATSDGGLPDGGAVDSVRTFPGDTGPSVTARPANAALVAFTAGNNVYATTLAY